MELSTKRILESLQLTYDEEKANDILSNLVEDSFQYVKYGEEEFIFDCFHYDGVLLTRLTDEFRQLYVGKWWIQNIVIL